MRLFNSEFSLFLNRQEIGKFESFRHYFKQKMKQLVLLIAITCVVFYFSGFLSRGIDKLRAIAPIAVQQMSADD